MATSLFRIAGSARPSKRSRERGPRHGGAQDGDPIYSNDITVSRDEVHRVIMEMLLEAISTYERAVLGRGRRR